MNPACWAGLAARAHCSSAELWMSSLLSSAWKKISTGQICRISKIAQILEVKSVNLSGCLDLWQSVKDKQQNLAPSSILPPKERPDGKSHTGLCGHTPQGQGMGTEIQQRSLIWRAGENEEVSTMHLHPSLPLFPPPCVAVVGVQRQMLLSINFSNKKDYVREFCE